MFNLFRLCRKKEISFEIKLAISSAFERTLIYRIVSYRILGGIFVRNGNIVTKNGYSVEATFDIVERIVRLVAPLDNVASTLLLVWTGPNGQTTR